MNKFTGNITQNFTWRELLHSDKAIELGTENIPTEAHTANLRKLADHMEWIRAKLGRNPIKITSGYRSVALNEAVGGSPTSAHSKGMACDFVCFDFGHPDQIVRFLVGVPGFVFDQLITERNAAGGVWVHVGFREDGTGRREVLKGQPTGPGGKIEYTPFS